MHVAQLWRHPVKSLQGEQLHTAEIQRDGMAGDRAYGIRDLGTGRILTARREPALLLASAAWRPDGPPSVTLPAGAANLSAWLGRTVEMVAAAGAEGGRAEAFADATDDASDTFEWTMPAGRFVDVSAVLVLTTASLRAGQALHPEGDWGVRRFRPNILVEADGADWVEDAWAGRPLRVGEVELSVVAPCSRCTMVTRPQPGIERDLDMYRTLARHHNGTLAVWCSVTTPGTVAVGDAVEPR